MSLVRLGGGPQQLERDASPRLGLLGDDDRRPHRGPPLVAGDSIYFAGGWEGSSSNEVDRVEVYTAPDLLVSVDGNGPDSLDRLGASVPVGIVERVPGSLVPGSETLHYDVGAGPVQVPLVAGGPTGFLAEFPLFECGAEVSWYVSAASTGGTTYTFPDRAPADVLVSLATDPAPFVEFQMDADDGWTAGAPTDTATDGLWERGDPVGTETQAEHDHTPGPGGECWVTGIGVPLENAGEDDVDGGRTSLFTPVLDLTGVPDPRLSYWRWIYGSAQADDLIVEITDDGVEWIQAERIRGNDPEAKGGWYRSDVRLLDVAGLELTDSAQVRFVARDRFADNRFEVVLDDVVVTGCSDGPGGTFCDAVANSTGAPSYLAATGSRLVADNDVTLVASDLPQSKFGYFLCSLDRDVNPGAGGSSGVLCLGGAIGRYVGPGQVLNSGAVGAFELALDLDATPTPSGFVSIAPGETWHFKAWHRDTGPMGSTSNLTNGYVVVFE